MKFDDVDLGTSSPEKAIPKYRMRLYSQVVEAWMAMKEENPEKAYTDYTIGDLLNYLADPSKE